MSSRANKPFIELNCANLPDQLVEAELFGHRKGAFTGADYDRKGLFEEADGGTLFLDEIGDIPLTVQNRLLKAIDEKQIKRLGTNRYQFCDVQVIAATSRNLPKMVQAREFREDLYCRLAVLTIEASPLRERREDIPAMVHRFLCEASEAVFQQANRCDMYRIKEDALALLCECEYAGNIRALRNLVYELTSYVETEDSISIDLALFGLAKLSTPAGNHVNDKIGAGIASSSDFGNAKTSMASFKDIPSASQQSLLRSLAREGDITLPLELCILRRRETFTQWTARAKRCSIEAARQATGGTMQTAAERLGLTCNSLRAHLKRAKRTQTESLFDWQRQPD